MSGVMIGVDTGGTFTDIVLVDMDSKKYKLFKLASTKNDPSKAAVEGIREVLNLSKTPSDKILDFRYGTTVALNSILEGKYAKTALITTEGFKDILDLARQRRPHLYDLDAEKPDTIVLKNNRFEIDERLNEKGDILKDVKKEDVLVIVQELLDREVESVAIGLLNSYVNNINERKIAEVIKDHTDKLFLCTSSEVVSEFREYERFSSTVLNASLLPVMDEHLENFEQNVKKIGIKTQPKIMQSSGGIMSTKTARKHPINTFLSGPAAGVVGAISITEKAGIDNIITFDMGGTSTDVCLVPDGNPPIRREQTIAGLPVKTPSIDINTVGAGGGSIAWVDKGGLLKVGPQSSGAEPGPACYERGGEDPTVTDANLLLGRINPNSLLDGRMSVNRSLSEEVIKQKISKFIDMDNIEISKGILKIITHNIVQAIRLVSVEQGFDPRDFALVAYGGAGPLHAAEVAKELGVSRVIIPESPGLMSAMGLLYSDLKAEFSKTKIMEVNEKLSNDYEELLIDVTSQFERWYEEEGFKNKVFNKKFIIDMRYKGQDFELNIPLDNHEKESIKTQKDYLVDKFHEIHNHHYGYSTPGQPIEIVAVRLIVMSPSSNAPENVSSSLMEEKSLNKTREVWFDDVGFIETPIYSNRKFIKEGGVKGPAIIEQMDSTIVIPPNTICKVNQYGTLTLEL